MSGHAPLDNTYALTQAYSGFPVRSGESLPILIANLKLSIGWTITFGPRKSSHGRFSGIESALDGSSFRSIPALTGADKMVETRNAVEDIWGERKPYKHVWPDRVDQFTIEDPEKWVQSACVMCRLFGSCLHNVILLIYFAAMGVD
ncbi:hypothetical protein LTR43_012264 [Exophiala xenobiotica]